MKRFLANMWTALSLMATSSLALAQTAPGPTVPVTIDNYNRAQSDVYFSLIASSGGFGGFLHSRELPPVGQRGIIRPNRDMLYSMAVFDLDAGPVTVTLPDAGKRFMAMQVINEDQYTRSVHYRAGSYTLTRETVGTRYAVAVVRILVDHANKEEVRRHRLGSQHLNEEGLQW